MGTTVESAVVDGMAGRAQNPGPTKVVGANEVVWGTVSPAIDEDGEVEGKVVKGKVVEGKVVEL